MRIDLLLMVAVAVAASPAWADEPPVALPPADPDIVRIVSEISPERIQRAIFVLASFKTRHTLSDPLPSGDEIGGAASWIRADFARAAAESEGRLRVDLDAFVQPPRAPGVPHPVQITNIVATLPGSRPASAGRIYVVCAHYDSRVKNLLDAASPAPGADDDASGVAAVLELAHVLSHHSFPATIVFMAVAGQEEGNLGSAHWARQAKERGLEIAGMLDDDLIGGSRSGNGRAGRHAVRLFAQGVPPVDHPDEGLLSLLRAGGENDTPPRALARGIKDLIARYVPGMGIRLIYRADRHPLGGDQLPFLEEGYPAVRFTEAVEDYRHQREDVRVEDGVSYGDTPQFVDFAYVADVARVNAAALAGLARAPATPKSVQIDTAPLGNDTALRWAPNAEPDLAGYRIVWRETTAPFWEHSLDVGKDMTRRIVAGVSKDNVVFGVEAFDGDGHVSLAAFPGSRQTP